jgi:hypothetical protein
MEEAVVTAKQEVAEDNTKTAVLKCVAIYFIKQFKCHNAQVMVLDISDPGPGA